MDASSLPDVVDVLAVDLEVDDFGVTPTLSDRACWTLAEVEIGRSRTMVFFFFSTFLVFFFSSSCFPSSSLFLFFFVFFFLPQHPKPPKPAR